MNLTMARFGAGVLAIAVVWGLSALLRLDVVTLASIAALVIAVDTKLMTYIDQEITNHILKGLMNGNDGNKSA